MSQNILKVLPELIEAGVVTQDEAERIRLYYQSKSLGNSGRLIIAFGILGALLIGMGILLLIAHNWDNFTKPVKISFALAPLLIGQLVCAFALIKKNDNQTWRESSALFLFFAIAASISIVSQVYHIHGTLEGFLLVWIILSIPIVYVMQSSMTSLLVIGTATWYACEVSYFGYPSHIAWYYWPMMTALVPFYFRLMKLHRGNFFYFHSWLLVISLTISLGMFGKAQDQLMLIAYISLFSVFLLLGEMTIVAKGKLLSNAFLIVGNVGAVILLLTLTEDYTWKRISHSGLTLEAEFYSSIVVSMAAATLLFVSIRQRGVSGINPMSYIFIVFIGLYFTGMSFPITAQVLVNILLLLVGVFTVKRGADEDSLLIMNYGLLVITALIMLRFFDSNLSFVIRGILFIAMGIAFFTTNFWMMKKRKKQQL
jgi:uncharacterized membrane protein